jgi:hyperosmotically inducible periplasmic protein
LAAKASIAASIAKRRPISTRLPASADIPNVPLKPFSRQPSAPALFCKGEESMKSAILGFAAAAMLFLGVACNKTGNDVSYKDSVKQALEQAELKDVSVSEDRDKNTVTLGGTVHSDDAKAKAGDVAKGAAGARIVVNEVSVQPVGTESDARGIASNLDDAIEKNYKAALIASNLKKEHIDFNAKNGVLTLKGSVKTDAQRKEAEQAALHVPNVQQVLNEIEVKR